jgi:transposase
LLQERWQTAYAAGDLPLVRRTAVLLELAHGTAAAEVAAAYAITCQTVYDWLKAFLVAGADSLVYKHAPGRPARLTRPQQQKLVALVKAGPVAVGYLTACWTALLVQQLIEREFGVLFNRHYVCALLRQLGFSFQKARLVSDHLDPAARQQWLETTWAQVLRLRQDKDALILFGDEVGFAQWGSLGYTWALKGETPVVQTSGRRKGYKVLGVIDLLHGQFFYQAITERFNSETYQAFLQMVLDQTTQHLILVQDGARYHTSAATHAFFAAHQERLTVFQLPTYSPDYNPIEFLWRKIKRQATHNQYFPEFTDLQAAVDKGLAEMAKQTEAIKALRGPYVESLEALAA